jgi:hypothetical protein
MGQGMAGGAAEHVGWFRDPTKHHELRFRDEAGWTRRVSNFGVTGVDPYWAPPGWYRDPSRRFRYRYWDEDGWTALVATGRLASADPVDAVWSPPFPVGGRDDLPAAARVCTNWSENDKREMAVPAIIQRALTALTPDVDPSPWRRLVGDW